MNEQRDKYSISDLSVSGIVIRRKAVPEDFRLHWHDCCELEFVCSGSGVQVLNGIEFPLRSGEMYMLTPADCHSIHVFEPLDIIGVMFEDRVISPGLYERVLTQESLGINMIARMENKSDIAVRGLVDALMCESERDSDPELSEKYIGNILDCLIIELLRSCADDTCRLANTPVSTAILYLHRHYTERITLERLAELTHLSRNYFSELFKSTTGKSFKSYLIDLRLKNACRLLANTDLSVTDICFKCGFESFSNFMRTFKLRYETSPLRFRAENQLDGDNLRV